MLRFFYLIIFTLTITLGSCTGDGHASRIIARADSLATTQPDSAIALLTSLPDTALSPHHKAHRALLLAKASMMATGTLIDDSTIHLAAKYYAGRADSLEYQSMFYSAIALEHRDSLARALITLADAERLAATHVDYLYLARIQREIGEIYGGLLQIEDALVYSEKALKSFENCRYMKHAAWQSIAVANCLEKLGKSTLAIKKLDAIPGYVVSSSDRLYISYHLNRATSFYSLGRLDSLKKELHKISYFDGDLNSSQKLLLAQYYVLVNELNLSQKYIAQAQELGLSKDDSISYHYVNYLISEELQSSDAYAHLKNFSYKILHNYESCLTTPVNALIKHNYKEKNEYIRKVSKETKARHITVIISLIIIIIAIIIVCLFIRRNYMYQCIINENTRKELQNLESELNLLHMKYCHLDNVNELNKAILIKNGADNISNFKWFYNNLVSIVSKTESTDQTEYTMRILLSRIRDNQVFESLGSNINYKYNNLFSRVTDILPDLSDINRKLLLLIIAELSTSTIAIILDKPIRSIYTQKHRLKVIIGESELLEKDKKTILEFFG